MKHQSNFVLNHLLQVKGDTNIPVNGCDDDIITRRTQLSRIKENRFSASTVSLQSSFKHDLNFQIRFISWLFHLRIVLYKMEEI